MSTQTLLQASLATTGVRPGTIYIAGPMTGRPNYNYDAFASAAAHLRGLGYTVASPHEIDFGEDTPGTQPYPVYIKGGLDLLLKCDSICLLPGWPKSKGAMLELNTAVAAGMTVLLYDSEHGLLLP